MVEALPLAVGPCEVELLVVPVLEPVVVPCEVPLLEPPVGLAAGLAGAAGLAAGFLVVGCACKADRTQQPDENQGR